MLMGWGAFNLVEGTINHHLLSIHHVNQTVAERYWVWWDAGFLLWGAVMLVGGWFLARIGQREQELATASFGTPQGDADDRD